MIQVKACPADRYIGWRKSSARSGKKLKADVKVFSVVFGNTDKATQDFLVSPIDCEIAMK